MSEKRSANNLELISGRLCLDFANTVSSRTGVPRREYLPTYGELVAWARHVDILADDEASVLLCSAARHPDLATAVLERAIALRETICRVFAAIAQDRECEETDLTALNAALHPALARLEVRSLAGGFEWTWGWGEDDLDWILWPVARSAADLLTSEDVGRVGQCAREGCDWLFVDGSKNRSRRWCMMEVCGSRVKAGRYYRRKKEEAER